MLRKSYRKKEEMDQSMRKETWLEVLVAGGGDTPREAVPLEVPGEGPLDPDRYWVRFRDPTGVESDELQAVQSRDIIQQEVQFDPDDIENSRSVEVQYTDTRRTPVLFKAVDMGLIADAALPKKEKNGEIGVYKWSKIRAENKEFLLKQNSWFLNIMVYMVFRNLLAADFEELVNEGEESVVSQDVNTSGTTGKVVSEEV